MTTVRHSLEGKNLEIRRATCSVCGPVKIQRSGNGWTCGNRANAQSRKQKARRPDRPRESRTDHRLEWHDPELRTGLCAKCGPVDVVPWGRGYACGERAKELGVVNHQDKPLRYCDACKLLDSRIVWLTAGGCPRCGETDLNAMFAADAADGRLMAGDDWSEMGMHVVGLADPYEMPELENAVPGWRTLG